MRYAVFDLGSNSVKFLIAETVRKRRRIMLERSIATCLAENLIETCELRPAAIARTLAALRILRTQADTLGVTQFRAVATSAVRDSRNRREFLRGARAALGFPVRLLSGNEEAETIFTGVQADTHWRGRDLLIFDIGGGSTEWVQSQAGQLEKRRSLPLGCVRLRERFITRYPVGAEAWATMQERIQEQVAHGLAGFSLSTRRLIGTGGTASCLAALHKNLREYEPEKIDHTTLTLAQVLALQEKLRPLSQEKLRALPGLPPKRADLILPGLAVTLATMQALGASRLSVSLRGLRYGLLEQLIRETEA